MKQLICLAPLLILAACASEEPERPDEADEAASPRSGGTTSLPHVRYNKTAPRYAALVQLAPRPPRPPLPATSTMSSLPTTTKSSFDQENEKGISSSPQPQEVSKEQQEVQEVHEPPPDGGLKAWMTVFATFLASFMAFGTGASANSIRSKYNKLNFAQGTYGVSTKTPIQPGRTRASST